mmetsp:Transcript_40412/g.49007  ORF Transcript_40412/g.49007 Transcript_40412/m.49007 type:complete len:448 (+) Transcript_40412:103-1446(+)|eukprot:CAMPEP_0197847090 /NCGR_PEP_ID=MMETSP1438-20131217/5192_1 /TAXON_ID=1461541 /ORGANISM="Pterosperma sp., Strain CCMP1384" /LENGTH=447 /DNA_ID=CAMNT_0043458907 /DNA_START=97 /DNA_END=1440 /DNA_ORIENTATION=-
MALSLLRSAAKGVGSALVRPMALAPRMYSTTAEKPQDVVLVGGGIMGLNIAYQIKRRSPEINVTILEQAGGLGNGSSGYSTGFLRAFYSFDETMQVALDGIDAYKNWSAYTGNDKSTTTFTPTGALWMLGYDKCKNEAMAKRLLDHGVHSTVLDEDDFKKRFPLFSTEPFPEFNEEGDLLEKDYGTFSALHEEGPGHVDSNAALDDSLEMCQRMGVNVKFNSKVDEFIVEGDKATGVKMADGSTINAGLVINAAGPWCNKLSGRAGLDFPITVNPTRIHVGHKWIDGDYLDMPFVADGWGGSGIYFMPRRNNKQLVFGSVAHRFESEVVDPDDYDTSLDPDFKQDYLNCLHHRLPGLPVGGEIVGFSHMYSVAEQDVHPIIGPTKIDNLWVCNGFSGHGFKLAPAIGSMVAQKITGLKLDTWETDVDVKFFDPYRKPLTMEVVTHFA